MTTSLYLYNDQVGQELYLYDGQGGTTGEGLSWQAQASSAPSPNGFSSLSGSADTGQAQYDISMAAAREVCGDTRQTAQNQVLPPLQQQYQQAMAAASEACQSAIIDTALEKFQADKKPLTEFLGEQPFAVTGAGDQALNEYGAGDQQMAQNAQDTQGGGGSTGTGRGVEGAGKQPPGFVPPDVSDGGELPDLPPAHGTDGGSGLAPDPDRPGSWAPPAIIGGLAAGGGLAVAAQQPWRWVKGVDGKFQLEGDRNAYDQHVNGYFGGDRSDVAGFFNGDRSDVAGYFDGDQSGGPGTMETSSSATSQLSAMGPGSVVAGNNVFLPGEPPPEDDQHLHRVETCTCEGPCTGECTGGGADQPDPAANGFRLLPEPMRGDWSLTGRAG